MKFTYAVSKSAPALTPKKVTLACKYIAANKSDKWAIAFKASGAWLALDKADVEKLIYSDHASAIFEVDANGLRFKNNQRVAVEIAMALGHKACEVDFLCQPYEYSDSEAFERFACETLGYRWTGGLNYSTAIIHGMTKEEALAAGLISKQGKIVPDGYRKNVDGSIDYLEAKGYCGHVSRMIDLL